MLRATDGAVRALGRGHGLPTGKVVRGVDLSPIGICDGAELFGPAEVATPEVTEVGIDANVDVDGCNLIVFVEALSLDEILETLLEETGFKDSKVERFCDGFTSRAEERERDKDESLAAAQASLYEAGIDEYVAFVEARGRPPRRGSALVGISRSHVRYEVSSPNR